MGGKSKKQTIGYKYYLGQHHVLCHGPIDNISRIAVDERLAWSGTNTGGQINVDSPNLFGGDSREGGVSGAVDIAMGGAAQGQNSYLVSQLGSDVPAYRGVVSAILRRPYLGNNPYLKAWRYRGQRIHVRQNGIAQWYDAKAEIPSGGEGEVWRDDFTYANTAALLSQWTENDPDGRFIWTLDTHPATGQPAIRCQVLNNLSGSYQTTLSRQIGGLESSGSYRVRGRLYAVGPSVQPNNVLIEDWLDYTTTATFGQVTVSIPINRFGGTAVDTYYWIDDLSIEEIGASADLNPAHIIRECLTDPDWGMGYQDADIDSVSFTAAADQLYSEGLGVSLLWDRQIAIDDFIKEIVKHIDAALYVDRKTGKFVLKLIRDDYDPEDLIILDESNISQVTNPAKATFGELVNSVTVNYWDARTGKDASLTITDPALVQMQGSVINTTLQYPGFSSPRNAGIAGQRDLRVLSSPFLSCTIYTDSTAKDFNIGDTFKFRWSRWQITEMIMRVTGLAFGDGKTGQVRVTCTQDVYSTPLVSVVSPGGGTEWVDPSAPPDASDNSLAFEAPYYELVQVLGQSDIDGNLAAKNDIGYVMAAASRAGSAINARMWVDDGTGYTDTGGLDFAPYADLEADVDKLVTVFSVENTLDLDQVEVGTHCQIGDELCRIDAVDTVGNTITVGRGVLDTVPEAHQAGTSIFFWDLFNAYDPTEYVVGEELDVKVQPISGAGVVSLGSITADTITLQQRAFRPYPPGNLTVNTESYVDAFYEGLLTVAWAHRDRLQQTSGTLADHYDADIGPEAGTTYRLQGYLDGVLVHTEDDIAGTSTTWTPSNSGLVKVEVHSKRDGIYSLQAPSHEFYYGGDLRVTESGDLRVTESGEPRVLEA